MKVYHFQQLGKRATQEDAWGAERSLGLFVVADGMGGAARGEIASNIVVELMTTEGRKGNLPSTEIQLQKLVQNILQKFTERSHTHPHEKGSGATMALLSWQAHQALIAHVGDSRVYHIRPSEEYWWRTKDHSFVQELFDLGVLVTEAEMKKHPQRNQLTKVLRALEEGKQLSATVTTLQPLAGDIFMICSDGVLEAFTEDSLQALWREENYQLENIVMRMKTQCANESTDNNTAIFIEVEATDLST